MEHFFITGFPRTRTAWFSLLFSTGDVFCYHEAGRWCHHMNHINDIMNLPMYSHVGNSSSIIPIIFNNLKDKMKESPFVMINRPRKEVEESLKKVFPWHDMDRVLDITEHGLENIKRKTNLLIVDFKDLDNMEAIEAIWKHCLPGKTLDSTRFSLMNDLCVKIHMEKYLVNIARFGGPAIHDAIVNYNLGE